VLDRRSLAAGVATFLLGLLAPGTSHASVKCQCNDGSIVRAMGADYDDEDVDAACNDACSTQGGGRVWSVDRDRNDDDDDGTTPRGGPRQPRPATPDR
jgi:hypothetical protein